MSNRAVFVGDVCYRDDFEARHLVVSINPGRTNFIVVNLVAAPADPQCSNSRPHVKGEIESFGPNILNPVRVATPREMMFAWGVFAPRADDGGWLAHDRCAACAARAVP